MCLQVCARSGLCFLAGQQCGGLSPVRWCAQMQTYLCQRALEYQGENEVEWENEWRRGVAFSVEQIERHHLQREHPLRRQCGQRCTVKGVNYRATVLLSCWMSRPSCCEWTCPLGLRLGRLSPPRECQMPACLGLASRPLELGLAGDPHAKSMLFGTVCARAAPCFATPRPASSRSTLCPDQGGGAVQCCALAPAVLQVPRAAAKAYAMDRYACSKLSPVTGVSTHTC